MKRNRVYFIFLSFFIITLIFQGFIPSPINRDSDNLQTIPNSPIETSVHDTLTGIGYGLNYTEYANRTDSSTLSLYYNTLSYASGSGTTTLAANWEGYMMDIQVYDLTLNRTYLDNYDFENGQTSWTEVEVDTGWDNIQTGGAGDDIYVATGAGPGGGADDCAHVQQVGVLNTGYYRFDDLDRAAFSQQITIQGGSVIWAGLDFDYYADCNWASSLFHAYMRVGTTEVWKMGFGPLDNPGVWQHQDMLSLNTTPFTSTVTLEIGLQSDGSVGYSTQPDPIFRYDNLRLYIVTAILPSLVGLQMNSLSVNDNGQGNGYVTQVPGTRWQSSPPATFTWGPIPSLTSPDLPATIDFSCEANLFALKEGNLLYGLTPGSYGTDYTISDGVNTSWEIYTLIATPDGYWNHYYNFTHPLDWEFTGLYEPQNPTVNIISQAVAGGFGDGYIQINLTEITNSPAGYWRLTAESPNYVTEVTPTDLGVPQTDFRIGDTLRVRSTVTNAATGYANLSIYNPSGALWNSEEMKPGSDQFFFSDINLVGPTTPAGEYEIVVWWNNRSTPTGNDANEAGLRRTTCTVTHATQLESYDIATIQTDTFMDVLYNETFVLKAKYTDTDNGLGIDGATVQIEWIDGTNYTMTGLGGGFYLIDSLNTSQAPGVYLLDVFADKSYYDGATKQITVELAHHTSLTLNTTSVTVDWGESVTIRAFYNDTDINAGVVGASVWVLSGWQGGSWSNVSAGVGNYDLTFDTTWTTPDTVYDVDVTADLANYQLKTRQVSIFVKARSSELSYLPPPAVPIQDVVNVTINYIDGVNGSGISNGTNQLYFSINSSLNGYFSIHEISAGVFYLEINTSAPIFTQPDVYSIDFAANWIGAPYYANHSMAIKLTVRQIITSLTYDPPGDSPFGNNVNLTVHYQVTDTDSKFNGIGIDGAQVNITTGGYSYGVNYTVSPHASINGDYIITIYNSTLNSIDTFSITIEASGLTNYASNSKALGIKIRKIYTSVLISPPGNIPYGDNVNISLQISYSDPDSQFYDGLPISGLTAGDVAITGGHSFNLHNIGSGNYIFEVLNGTVLTLGTYNEYIALLEAGLYLSDNRSVSWTIRKLISTITVDSISDLPYGNAVTTTIHAIYDDSASQWYNGQGITGLVTANFSLPGHTIAVSEIGNGDYTLTIDNATILTLGLYLETLTLSAGAIFEADSTSLSFTVRNLYTELVADLVPAQPLGEDVTITVYYRVKDTASLYYDGQGVNSAQINITTGGYSYGTDYTVNEIGNGEYQVAISSSALGAIQSYIVDLEGSGVANYDNATTSSSFDVRAIATSFVYVSPSPTAWGFNVTIDLSFSVEDSLSSQNGNPLPGAASITVNETDPSFVGDWSDLTGGNYQVELNTSGLSMGTYWANISIYIGNYVNRSLLVRFILRAHFTQVTYAIPDPTPWGKNSTLTVYLEDIDLGFANVYPVADITINESQSFSYNWVDNGDGSFSIDLDTTDPTAWPVGTHRVEVKIYQFAYENSTTLITLTIKTRDTDLIYQTPDITPFLQNATVKIQFRDLKNSTSPVGINNNTNPQIPGLQNSAGNVSISVTILDSSFAPVGGAIFWIYIMEGVAGYGDGWYNVTIDTNSLGLTGTYYADIDVDWLALSYYNNQTIRIPFNVRNITALLEYQPPGSTPYAAGGYISVWLKYSDIDNSLPIDDSTVSIYYIEDPGDIQLTPFTTALGNYSVEGTGVGDNTRGSGWYLVKIFMGSDKLNAFGSYDFAIQFNKTNYDTRSITNITFAIRQGYTQFTSPYAPVSFVINGIVNISINYIDSESGIGIVNTTAGDSVLLNWTWPYNATLHPDVLNVFGWSNGLSRWVESGDEGNYPMGQDGRYLLQIDFSSIPVGNRTIISMNITAGRNVQSQVLNITFITEPQTSVMGVTFPQPVVWGENSVFNITYQKLDGTGIAGTAFNLWDLDQGQFWNASYWSYVTIDAGIGLYGVTVNTTLYPPPSSGFFRIRVDASGGAYTPRSLNVFLNVRPIDSQVALTPPAATGWNTLANVSIQYYDTYNSVPINDSDITDLTDVLINVTNVPSTYWTLYNGPSDGLYIVEINTSYWASLNTIGHTIYVDVSWEGVPYYKNWTGLTVGIPVRERSTDLSYIPPLQIPYGANSSIIFEWRDLEIIGGQGIENTSGKVLFELRDWLNQAWNSSGFAWILDSGSGLYEVRINSSKLPSVGSYTFTAYFNWPDQPFYSNRSISFGINVRQINTILTYIIPAPIPFGNPFQFNVQFNISDSSSSLDRAHIVGAMINITSISNSGGPLSPFSYGNNYSVVENGLGSYTVTIFNTSLDVDSYSFSIRASRYHIEQIYTNATASLGFTVRALTTSLTYVSPLPVPWGNNVSISLSYVVNDPSSLYWDGFGLDAGTWTLTNGSSWTEGLHYAISGSGGSYIVSIDNDSVYGANIGTFTFDITVNSTSNRYLPASFANIPFSVRALTTSLTYIPTTPEPFGNNITIQVLFNVSDPESWYYDGTGLDVNTWSLSNISGPWASGTEYEILGSSGVYTLSVINTVYSNIGVYSFDIQANSGSTLYADSSLDDLPFTIRALTTSLTYIPATLQPFGNNVTIQVFFNISDPASVLFDGMGLDVSVWSLSNISGPWSSGIEYIITGSGGSYMLIVINNIYSNIGTFTFDIQVDSGVALYDTASFLDVPFTIRALTTALTYIPTTPEPYGNNVTIQFFYNVTDPASVLFNGLGLDATFSLSNASGPWSAGVEYIVAGNSGIFYFTIINIVYDSPGTYYFDAQANPSTSVYTSASINNVLFYIRELTTALSIIPVSPVPFGNNVTGLQVFFNVSDPGSSFNGLGIDATFSLSNASGPWSAGVEYLVSGGSGAFDFTIISDVYNTVGSYSFDIQANPISSIYSSAIFINVPFTIRPLTTTLSYVPTPPTPYGNNVTIGIFMNVSDSASVLYDGLGLSVGTWSLSNASGAWSEGVEYLVAGTSGDYTFTILNNVYSNTGSYSFDISADASNVIYETASLTAVPFLIRNLMSAVSYNPATTQPFGNNVSIEIFFNVSDPSSVLNGLGLDVSWSLSNSSGSWTDGNEYEISGSNGVYLITIKNLVYSTIGTYSFDLLGAPAAAVYSNASFPGIPFTIRALSTAISWIPAETQPWGNPINVTIFYNVSDPVSVLYNGIGLDVAVWTLSNSTGSWTSGIEYIVTGGSGVFLFTLDNETVTTNVGSFTFNVGAASGNVIYQPASISDIPFTIRPLTTRLTYTPVPNIPWGNNVTISFLYNVSDAASLWYNNQGISGATLTVTRPGGWNLWADYSSFGGSGAYTLDISNETVNIVQNYAIDVEASTGSSRYEIATVLDLPFTIRELATVLTYDPVTPIPWGNNVTVTVTYRVNDPESDWYDGQAVVAANFNITDPVEWNQSLGYWTWSGSSGSYNIVIINNTVNVTGSYAFDLVGIPIFPVYSRGYLYSIPFTIRELATVITYDPITPQPWGNNINISIHYQVSDPESVLYNGQGVPVSDFNVTNPGWNQSVNWTWSGSGGDYIITVLNNTANTIGSYTLDLVGLPLLNGYSQGIFNNIPFSVRTLNTFLTYPVPAKNSWGNNATLDLQWQVIDAASQFHDGELIEGGLLEITDPTNWTYWLDYISEDNTGGSYTLNINKDTVNEIKTYIIDIKAFHLSVNYYGNTTYIGLPFSVLQVVTSHTTIINSTYYLDGIGGWPWGDQVNVTIFYNDTDHGTLVPNSNMSVRGDAGSPFESGNFTINGVPTTTGGSTNGVFILIINGTVAENAIGYNFYITLFHSSGNYLNHSYIFTISFRKTVTQIILKNPPVFIPWGDNITILFTYNNSEAVGFPGIPGADVNVTVDNPAANESFNYIETPAYGDGAWIITMNTTWANVTWNTQVEVTFTITAVAPETIIAQSFHTVFITPLDSDIKTIIWDNAVFLELYNSFNVTVEVRDRSHINGTEGNLIVNNSYWTPTGSIGQYANLQFIITTREGQFTNYTWYWGNISVTTLGLGTFKLTFHFNQTPDYPTIQELLDYLVIIEVRGDRLDTSQTQVTVDLKIKTHRTAMTFNWTYANSSSITPSFDLANFSTFTNGSQFVYGNTINVYFYWWDLDSGAFNPGIHASFVAVNWTDPLYYQVFNLYELNSQNESYKGLYWIRIDTGLFSEVVGNYTLIVNASLETYQRTYLLTQGIIDLEILPVPINITLTEPLVSTPITAFVRIPVNFTNYLTGEPVIVRVQELNITNVPGPMGANKWAVSTGVPGEIELFIDSNVLGLGFHTLIIKLNKTNHQLTYKNYTIEVRLINTTILMQDPFDERLGDWNLTAIYRENYTVTFFYQDDTETYIHGYTRIGRIPLASFNISDWQSVGGRATLIPDQVPSGVYQIDVEALANVGTYFVNITANRTNFALASYIMNFTIIQASSTIDLVNPDSISFQIWKFGSQGIEIRLSWISKAPNYFKEVIQGNLTFAIKNNVGVTVATGNFVSTGVPGHYTADIDTGNLNMQESYDIVINATPTDGNYAPSSITLIAFIKPIWEHPIFIFTMIGLAAVVGAYTYRKVKWLLLPREIKAIEIAKKEIKKGRAVELPFRDIKDREFMFSSLFADAWAAIGIKPPKLVRPEVVLFATELSTILRMRVTSPEAELLINTLKKMSVEEAGNYLSGLKVPPEATRRLLMIAGLIEKQRLEVVNFAQMLSDIKGIEISYSQANDILTSLQPMSRLDADKYLEAMVIPKEDRMKLLGSLGIKPLTEPKKIKRKVEEKPKEKVKEAPKESHPLEERPMSLSEIQKALNQIIGLSEDMKKALIEDMKNLPLKEQIEVLKNLKG